MISVYITDDGGLAYRCSVCDFTMKVSGIYKNSVSWPEFNGTTIQEMIEHYGTFHDSRSVHPGKELPNEPGQ